jgi:hypothetical protein
MGLDTISDTPGALVTVVTDICLLVQGLWFVLALL